MRTEQPEGGAIAGTMPGTRITECYARMAMRDTCFWAWPVVR